MAKAQGFYQILEGVPFLLISVKQVHFCGGKIYCKNWEMVTCSWGTQMLLRTQIHASVPEKVSPTDTDAGVGWGGGRRLVTPEGPL